MNQMSENVLKRSNEEALYNVLMYLIHLCNIEKCRTAKDAMSELGAAYSSMSSRNKRRYKILSNGIAANPDIGLSEILCPVVSSDGFTACTFRRPDRKISVVFRGTGSGEWIDNGEALSGIPETNTYITYSTGGKEIYRHSVKNDYATRRQVQALNYFSEALSEIRFSRQAVVSVSGHSKGGNKAQFVAVNSDLVRECYSFSGQGFSPEAISQFKSKNNVLFSQRCRNIISISAENDYVNVLGKRIMPESNVYYIRSSGGLHYAESILNSNGHLNPRTNQGIISEYVQNVSDELMKLNPDLRKYATVGVMSIFQKHFGGDTAGKNEASILSVIPDITATAGKILSDFINSGQYADDTALEQHQSDF